MSSNGRWVLSSSRNGTISIWDVQKLDLLCELYRGHDNGDFYAEFSMVTDYIVSDYHNSLVDDYELLLWQYKGI